MVEIRQLARGKRMREARFLVAARLQEAVSQATMAEIVSKVIRRPLSQSAWSDYEIGAVDPPLDVLDVTAVLSGLPREYLAWGPNAGESDSPVGESSHVGGFPDVRTAARSVAEGPPAEPKGLELHDATQEAAEIARRAVADADRARRGKSTKK